MLALTADKEKLAVAYSILADIQRGLLLC